MYQVVLSTCPNMEVAEHIAKVLIEEKLVACVNILPAITSIYQWQGEVMKEPEVQLLIKSKQALFANISERIAQLHPYEVAEIIALDIKQGNQAYLQWIDESLTQ